MMQLYPAHAAEALEFDKIRQLLLQKCRTDAARELVQAMRFHTRIAYVEEALEQTAEFRATLSGGDYFPNDFTHNIEKELKLLSLPGAVLSGEQLALFRQLSFNTRDILLWLKKHEGLFPRLKDVAGEVRFHKEVPELIAAVVDDAGQVRDNASPELMQIRAGIAGKRQELRRVFEGILRKLNKQGYLADIAESFLNGRRTVAVFAEHKRIVKGILHGESDSQRTVFIEPEETIALNNELQALERAEGREIHRILAQTTAALSAWHPELESWYHLCGAYDFIRARALLAAEMNAVRPRLSPHPGVQLVQACHPLLLLQYRQTGKQIVPLDITLDRQNRILIISGPNAGGKTVAMKTIGLLQLMTQAGLMIPADERSEVGIFGQLMIHIGDTQSIEHELSTYSAHLRDMKYFTEFANGRTLFFIDELGSGSDPALGGAFAEAILEALARKKALGVVTTHYLNLKVMAGKVPGIFNGAMGFDEARLEPLYRLVTGRPGSSYTFAVAERSGLSPEIINRARKLTEQGHVRLDKLLHQAEQQALRLAEKEREVNKLLQENKKRKARYEELTDKEKLKQHYATLKLQNQIKKEELEYLRDMERKFRQIIQDWKKAENKQEVIEAAEKVLFRKKQIQANAAMARKADKNYEATGAPPRPGDLVRHRKNHQVGQLIEVRDKRGIVRIGQMPFHVQLEEWIAVRKKEKSPPTEDGGKG
jgi:DNA mismatch repair protein MutS2